MTSKIVQFKESGEQMYPRTVIEAIYKSGSKKTLDTILADSSIIKIPVASFPDFIANPNSIADIVGSEDQAAINEYCKSVLASVTSDCKFFAFTSKSDGGTTSLIAFSNGDVAANITLELYGASFTYYDYASKKNYLYEGSLRIIKDEVDYSISSDFSRKELSSSDSDVYKVKGINTLTSNSTADQINDVIGSWTDLLNACDTNKVIMNAGIRDEGDMQFVFTNQVQGVPQTKAIILQGSYNTNLYTYIIRSLDNGVSMTFESSIVDMATKADIDNKVYYVEGIQRITTSSTQKEIESVISSWNDLKTAIENGSVIKNNPTFENEIQFVFTSVHLEGEPTTEIFLECATSGGAWIWTFTSSDEGVTVRCNDAAFFDYYVDLPNRMRYSCSPFGLSTASTSSQINSALGGYTAFNNAVMSGSIYLISNSFTYNNTRMAPREFTVTRTQAGNVVNFTLSTLFRNEIWDMFVTYNTSSFIWKVLSFEKRIGFNTYYLNNLEDINKDSSSQEISSALGGWDNFIAAVTAGYSLLLRENDDVIHVSARANYDVDADGYEVMISFLDVIGAYVNIFSISGTNDTDLTVAVKSVSITSTDQVLTIRNAGALADTTATSDAIKAVFDSVGGFTKVYNLSKSPAGLFIQADFFGITESLCNSRVFEDDNGKVLLLTGIISDDGSAPYLAFSTQVIRSNTGVYSVTVVEQYNLVFLDPESGYISLGNLPPSVLEPFVSIKVNELEAAIANGFTIENLIGVSNPTQSQINVYCNDLYNRVEIGSRQFIFASTQSTASMLNWTNASVHKDATNLEITGLFCKWYDAETPAELTFTGSILLKKTGNNWTPTFNINKRIMEFVSGE